MKTLKISALIALMIAALVLPCTHPSYFIAEPSWIAEEPFMLECLSKTPATDQPKMDALVKAITAKYPTLNINVQSLPINADVNERKNSDKAPIVTFQTGTSGHGLRCTIARFEKRFPTIDDFKMVIESPTKKELIKQLTKIGFVALVIESSWDKAKNERLLKCAERGIKMAKDMANQKCGLVKVNLGNEREKYLFNNIYTDGQERKPGILLVFGKGKGLHFTEDDAAPNVIMEIAQQLSQTTSAEAQNLAPRIVLDMPMPAMMGAPQ
ncbi:MAG: hypothetical protein JNL74_17775 [Fibrobacteres bacterium]|nr:hypothetical protein [Fibrobacterota bacterium]